jgi:uncharacterized protein (AIM24 family)
LGFEAALEFREDPSFEFRRVFAEPFLKFAGSGAIAVALGSAPTPLTVTPMEPLALTTEIVVAYFGAVEIELIGPGSRYAEFGDQRIFRFTGTGTVLIDAV